jgi:PTS system nitrogen regulatory IIA component
MSFPITPSDVVPQLRAASKKQVLQEVARRGASRTGEDERTVLELLIQRERLGSTAIGGGVAIPHARIATLDRVYGLFARLERPIDFDAIDNEPVDLVFMLLTPTNAGADHLKALARVSRLLRDQPTCRKLRGATSADAIYALLTYAEGDQAA